MNVHHYIPGDIKATYLRIPRAVPPPWSRKKMTLLLKKLYDQMNTNDDFHIHVTKPLRKEISKCAVDECISDAELQSDTEESDTEDKDIDE